MIEKNTKEKIFIWGAGGHGKVLLDIFRKTNQFQVAYFLDDNPSLKGKFVDEVMVLGGGEMIEELKKRGVKRGIAGVGDCEKRCEMYQTIKDNGFFLVNAIDPSVVISPTAKIGKGITIWAGSVINTHSVVEDNVIINDGAVMSHDNYLGFAAQLGAGAVLMGGACIGEKTLIGVGATVIAKEIGKNSIIGAGSMVSYNIPDNVIAVGFPARVVGKRQ